MEQSKVMLCAQEEEEEEKREERRGEGLQAHKKHHKTKTLQIIT
jgi:hypothetical protein